MRSPYPFLISVPHCGFRVPDSIRDRLALPDPILAYESDPETGRIYQFRERVAAFIDSDVSRVIVDLNRRPYDLPPRHPDGVVKSITVSGNPVFLTGRFPPMPLIHRLLMDYYFPYHEQIDRLLDSGGVSLGIDCHSMLPFAPPGQKDAGKKRPLICLGNNGDRNGKPRKNGLATCPDEWIKKLAVEFRLEFAGDGDVAINTPFSGGFITNAHFWHRGIPWIQLEVNRSLYEGEEAGNSDRSASERTGELRERIWGVLAGFWDAIEQEEKRIEAWTKPG
jgi:N-formylglutamate deformylase